jgi:signal transduction histidine kinase
MLNVIGQGSKRLALVANDAAVAYEQTVSSEMFFIVESVARARALAGYAAQGHTTPQIRARLGALFARYHHQPDPVVASLSDAERARFDKLLQSEAWASLTAGDDTLVAGEAPEAVEWARAGVVVTEELAAIYLSHAESTSDLAAEHGRENLLISILAGVAALIITGAVMAAAVRSARRLLSRLKRLQARTDELADRDLPAIVGQAAAGEHVDPQLPLAQLDFGSDEIGRVARSFGRAQQVAVSAAVAQAEIRHGLRAVSLNIAHRSQAITHRQLEVLDHIERSEDDPELMEQLFRLDHLATRARRHAENLIILGGEQVGRQWRRPVPLDQVIRGAVSEARHYSRVSVHTVPDLLIEGGVVADVGHLLAELVDNGTAFSPPDTHVQVRASRTGRGLAIEVEDQGLGMDAIQLERWNELLRQPPDFSFMALTGELRLGLFVVAALALKHGVRVTLRESVYGGTQAVAVLPAANILAPGSAAAGEPAVGRVPLSAPAEGSSPVNGAGGECTTCDAAPPPGPSVSAVTQLPHVDRAAPGRPALPLRIKQNRLAPQLADPPSRDVPVTDGRQQAGPPQNAGTALSAFQRGTAQARDEINTIDMRQGGAE